MSTQSHAETFVHAVEVVVGAGPDDPAALFTDDVHSWELYKLRLLNAAHSTMAYLCALADLTYVDQAFADPQVRELDIVQNVGDVPYLGQPVTLSRTPSRVVAHPPALGEHTAEVLRDLGYDDAGIARLKNDGII